MYLSSTLLKNPFILPQLFCNVEFKFSLMNITKHFSGTLILKIKMLLEFKNNTSIEIIGFVLNLSDIDF